LGVKSQNLEGLVGCKKMGLGEVGWVSSFGKKIGRSGGCGASRGKGIIRFG